MDSTALVTLVSGQIDAQQGISSPLDLLIYAWLQAKWTRTNSVKTLEAYASTLLDFRARMALASLELDNQEDEALTQIALAAQGFARLSARPGKQVARSTINQRLAILSSFFEFAIKQGGPIKHNPIKRAERARVEQYAGAHALPQETVERRLGAIDRTTRQGKRDYAILATLLATGRRLNEVGTLRLKHLIDQGDGAIRVEFEHCKGGKKKSDLLPLTVSRALLEWLKAYYGPDIAIGKAGDDRPVWLSLSHRVHDKALGEQSIADVCTRWLKVSKVHTTRHTFSLAMIEAGAPLPVLQDLLGHESLDTTGRYAKSIVKAENPYADKVAANLGIK
jgi:integrase